MKQPLQPKDIEKNKKKIIKGTLKGNLNRFLRKHWKQHLNQFVYYKYIKVWRRDKKLKRIALSLLDDIKTPRNVCAIVNIMITLKKHYGYSIDEDNALVSKKIWDYLDQEIIDYVKKKKKNIPFKIDNMRRCFREQKARGFVHINDFEDYDNRFGYLFSNIDFDYVLPIRFYHNHHKDYHLAMYDVYHGQFLYGVEGWTRIQLPGKFGIAK